MRCGRELAEKLLHANGWDPSWDGLLFQEVLRQASQLCTREIPEETKQLIMQLAEGNEFAT